MSKTPRPPKEIVEYRHMAPFRCPPEDIEPSAMIEVARRVSNWIARPDCPLSPEQNVDVCRLLGSREREWRRADRAERALERAYLEGRQDEARATQRGWWHRRAAAWQTEAERLRALNPAAADDAARSANQAVALASWVGEAALSKAEPRPSPDQPEQKEG